MKTQIDNEKTTLIVPEGIRYISEWEEYNLDDFGFPHILDKKIPGCGYTEYCLTNQQNLILCSPRRILLENKESQHLGEIFYFKNELLEEDLGIDKNINKPSKTPLLKTPVSIDEDLIEKSLKILAEKLDQYIFQRVTTGKPIKIIVTYDSFALLREMLDRRALEHSTPYHSIYGFQIVIDEFQSVFTDSRFKSNTEMKFLKSLHGLTRLCFVSATPMMEKYLREIDTFKELPYFELNWDIEDPLRVCKPNLRVRRIQSVNQAAFDIIQKYKTSDFSVLANPISGELVESKEAVFYVNSVSNILGIIKKSGLVPSEVNILCANTPENVKKIKSRLGRGFSIGSIPHKDEPHKMFTFCTRTVYLGADFYSTCARTFVLSDANIGSMAVDISLDLPQILGRQRLLENPWKNHAEFYYIPLGKGKDLLKEDFDKELERKLAKTKNLLISYDSSPTKESKYDLAEKYEKDAKNSNYRDDYVAVNPEGKLLIPVQNDLVIIAEKRAFDIQQIDYKDRFTVFNTIKGVSRFSLEKHTQFIETLRDTKIHFSERLKLLCETPEFTDEEKVGIAREASEAFDKYYNILGPIRCKALSYSTDRLRREISDRLVSKDKIQGELQKIFIPGERYKKSDIKDSLRSLYANLGLSKTPKASDLIEYFETKEVIMVDPITKKKDHGLEILKIK